MTTSASSGRSYGSEIPVNSFTMPARAIRTPQPCADRGRREPVREFAAFVQAPALLRSGDVEDAHTLRDLVFGNVGVQVFRVHHLTERHHRHTELYLMRAQRLLRV